MTKGSFSSRFQYTPLVQPKFCTMLFNSMVFPAFLLVVLCVYYCLKHRPQNIWLLAASYFFYGWWDWRFLFLLFVSTITDYVCAMLLEKFDVEKISLKTTW